VCFALFSSIYASSEIPNSFNLNISKNNFLNSLAEKPDKNSTDDLFSSQAKVIALETPDLKTMQGNTICAIATPCVVSSKVLGDTFGANQNQKEVVDYLVQNGDTVKSIADEYKISVNTLLWANEMTSSSKVKVGQTLSILPVDGVLHIVKKGDLMTVIASKYKAKADDIISYNNLANQDDIYEGDILVVPGGVMPKNAPTSIGSQVPLDSSFFIYPTQGIIWQGLHYYNAVDIANECGTYVRAAAAGTVQRAVGNGGYNNGMGNHITIRHSNGTVTYYGHLMTLNVKAGDHVDKAQLIGLIGGKPGMAGAGKSTGCHLHFQVTGARNWLTSYPVKTKISY